MKRTTTKYFSLLTEQTNSVVFIMPPVAFDDLTNASKSSLDFRDNPFDDEDCLMMPDSEKLDLIRKLLNELIR